MDPESKIYIVVAVLAVILVGLFAYLFVMDRKITRIEKEIMEDNPDKKREGRKI